MFEDVLWIVDVIFKSVGVFYFEIEFFLFENFVINFIGRDGE